MRKAIRSSLGRMKWLKYVTPLILPKIVYRQGFMLLFLSNGNSNETGVFSPFLQKCQRSSIYGAFRTFYILQVLDITNFLEKYFPLSSYMFSYLSKSFNRSKSVCHKGTWVRISPLAPKRGIFCVPLFFCVSGDDEDSPLYLPGKCKKVAIFSLLWYNRIKYRCVKGDIWKNIWAYF